MATDLLRTLIHSLEEELPRAVGLRERLHASPEPGHGEHVTARLVAEALDTEEVEHVVHTGRLARQGRPSR